MDGAPVPISFLKPGKKIPNELKHENIINSNFIAFFLLYHIRDIYSVYESARFVFYILDRLGFFTVLDRKPHVIVILEVIGVEHSGVGDFEVMNVS